MKVSFALVTALATTLAAGTLYAQATENPIPSLVRQNGHTALMVDGAPFLVLNVEDQDLGLEATWPPQAKEWQFIENLHATTAVIPLYWDQIEPQPGQFDFSSIDRLLTSARAHNLRLVFLWFATWKNGSQHYMPDWMLADPVRYFHSVNRRGEAVDSPSPLCAASLEEDKKAFAAVMGHIKDADPQRTVIMMQVENEPGDWQSVRDFSPTAQKVFEAPVPPEILKAKPPLTTAKSPNWQEAYGPDADEYFNAWATAKYIGDVAAAGKAVYPLPMFINDAMRNPFHPGPAGEPGVPAAYESGDASDNVLDIWKAAGPAIDTIAPDDYQGDPAAHLKNLELYSRPDNPLMLVENGCPGCDPSSGDVNRYFFTALNLGDIGFPDVSLYEGSSDMPTNFALVGPMQRDVAKLMFEGKLQAVAEPVHYNGGDQGDARQIMHFGTWDAVVKWGSSSSPFGPATGSWNPVPEGRALVAQIGDNKFLVAGYFCTVDFYPAGTPEQQKSQHIIEGNGQIVPPVTPQPAALIDGKWVNRQFLQVEQGIYEDGAFKLQRSQNGDTTDYGLRFGNTPMVLRVTLGTF